jgi:replicative DNA helicase
MEPKLFNQPKILEFKHISSATSDIVRYINDRRKFIVRSLRTRWDKFNKLAMGGIEPNAVYTIAGISGSGKSSFVNTLETDIIDLNKDEAVVVLSFSFEMISAKQIGRKLSYKLRKTTSELYSASDRGAISDDEFSEIESKARTIKDYPVYYVDNPGTVNEIKATIEFFQKTIAKDKWLVVIIDHTLLVRGNSSSDSERSVIVELEKELIALKKVGKTSIIQIAQMNRNIEAPERINNPSLHYPQRSDIASSDAVFQASDYVIIIHRPEILGILTYGYENLPTKDMVYLHFTKNREGDSKILRFINDLKHNNLIEPKQTTVENDSQLKLDIKN